MTTKFLPKTKYEKFCKSILDALVENSSKTYICGGTTRDTLLNKKLKDFDISTDLLPNKVMEILKHNSYFSTYPILFYPNFGVVKVVFKKFQSVDISTFRKEIYKTLFYPEIMFVKSVKTDSERRDFTINSLYLKHKNEKILDFHKGLNDLQNKLIRFIGNPETKIKEDPFRMIRALRFALELNFKIEKNSWLTLKKYFSVKKLGSKNKILQEITKLKNQKQRKLLKKIIFRKLSLDKFPNKFYYK